MTRAKPLIEVKPLFLYVIVDTASGLPAQGLYWSRTSAREHMKLYSPNTAAGRRIRRAKLFVYNK